MRQVQLRDNQSAKVTCGRSKGTPTLVVSSIGTCYTGCAARVGRGLLFRLLRGQRPGRMKQRVNVKKDKGAPWPVPASGGGQTRFDLGHWTLRALTLICLTILISSNHLQPLPGVIAMLVVSDLPVDKVAHVVAE